MRTLFFCCFFSAVIPGCITLDGLLPFHDNIACSQVNEETCALSDDEGAIWDTVCLTCDDAYNWQIDYPWRTATLDGVGVRPVTTKVQEVNWTTEDGLYTLNAYHLPSHGGIPELASTTVIYNHGRYANIEHYAPRVRMLHELGYGVFVWDYRGYGKSLPANDAELPAPPTNGQWNVDAQAAYEQAILVAPDPNKIILYGMSVGGIPAGEMAYQKSACALIFEASFNSIESKIETNLSLSIPGSFLTTGLVENSVKLSNTTIPTLVLQGDQDDRIHLDEAEALYNALPQDLPKDFILIQGAGHGLGGHSGGIPEQGLSAYGTYLWTFLSGSAAECLTPSKGSK